MKKKHEINFTNVFYLAYLKWLFQNAVSIKITEIVYIQGH